MVKTVCLILGAAFILVGLVGFFSHNFLGTHLSWAHNLVHLVSGALAIYFGAKADSSHARLFAIIFGIVYLSLGVAGYWLGTSNAVTLPGEAFTGSFDDKIFRPIPGILELGRADHVVHLLLGSLFLLAGIFSRARVKPLIDNQT